ncbi:unnamed protein product [Ascophyllum nodosum]
MVDACSRKCRTGGCDMYPSFAVTNARTAEYCAQHARLQCGVEGYMERKFDPHHFGKEAIGNVIPSGAKHKTVHPPPTKTNPPSGVGRDYRKRVRHPDVMSTASKRAASRGSAGGAGTMPDIEKQKSPVKRDSSVKTEVQLCL